MFSFKTKKISFQGYKIKLSQNQYPIDWKLEASEEISFKSQNWILLDYQKNQQLQGNIFSSRHILQPRYFSTFKFTLIRNTQDQTQLFFEYFDIFGILLGKSNSFSLF